MDNYLTWDEYFMAVALLSARRSKDPSTKVGACIVNTENKIIGVGYNGLPKGYDDQNFFWENRNREELLNKYNFCVHAELNAILNTTRDIAGARIYVTLFPCNECTKALIQSGIKEIIYLEDKYPDSHQVIASKMMLNQAKIIIRTMEKGKVINLKF